MLNVLTWLINYNSLYAKMIINRKILKRWSLFFIFHELQREILHVNRFDHHERQKYSRDFAKQNLKNEY